MDCRLDAAGCRDLLTKDEEARLTQLVTAVTAVRDGLYAVNLRVVVGIAKRQPCSVVALDGTRRRAMARV